MRRLLKTALVLAGCAALSGVAGTAAEAKATAAKPLQPITIAWQAGAMLSILDWTAARQGFFRDYGLTPKFVQTQSGAASIAAGLQGSVDVFYGPYANTVTAQQQGECFKFVTAGQRNPINIIARPGVSLPHKGQAYPGALADLKGLKVGVPNLGSATDRLTRMVISGAGVTDVTYIAVGVGSTAAAAFQNGQVDVLTSFPPAEQLIGKANFQLVANLQPGNPASPLKNEITSHSIVTCKYATENMPKILNYCRAIWAAQAWSQKPQNFSKMAQNVSDMLGLSYAIGLDIWKQYHDTFPTAQLTPAVWAEQDKFNPPGVNMPPFDTAANQTGVVGQCVVKDPRPAKAAKRK